MPSLFSHALRCVGLPALAAAIGLLPAATSVALDGPKTVKEAIAFSQALPNVPGKSLTAVVVSLEPGAKAGVHHHAGSVFAFILSGSIRSENSATGPARIYAPGESFFEPPGSAHLVTENASATAPASLLAVFIADDGAILTQPGR